MRCHPYHDCVLLPNCLNIQVKLFHSIWNFNRQVSQSLIFSLLHRKHSFLEKTSAKLTISEIQFQLTSISILPTNGTYPRFRSQHLSDQPLSFFYLEPNLSTNFGQLRRRSLSVGPSFDPFCDSFLRGTHISQLFAAQFYKRLEKVFYLISEQFPVYLDFEWED